jgi:hypothetical protein
VVELFTIFQNNIPHVVVADAEEEENFVHNITKGMYNLAKFNIIFSSINVETTKTTSPDDLVKIIARLREIGAVKVNNLLMDVVKGKLEEFHRLSLERIQPDSLEESHALNSQGMLYQALVKSMCCHIVIY